MAEQRIPKRYVAPLDNNNIEAGAGIESSKLADGANFLKKDGSVTMTGVLDHGGQKAQNLGTPTNSTDAATKAYVDQEVAASRNMFKYKDARAASTANVTVSNPGTAVFDGVTLSNGDILLLKNQSSQAENGLYVFNGSGSALTRATNMDAWTEVPGSLVIVKEGTTLADTFWLCTANDGGTLGTTAITFTQTNTGGGSGLTDSNFVFNQQLSGTVDGVNTTFTFPDTPIAGKHTVFVNNWPLGYGSGNGYTVSGNTATLTTAPLTGEIVTANYIK